MEAQNIKSENKRDTIDTISAKPNILSTSAEIAQEEHVAFIHHAHPHFSELVKHNEVNMTEVDIDRIRISPTRSTSTERSISSERVGSDFEYALPQYAHAKKHVIEIDNNINVNNNNNSSSENNVNITINFDNNSYNNNNVNASVVEHIISDEDDAKNVNYHQQRSNGSRNKDDNDEEVEEIETQSKNSSYSSVSSSTSSNDENKSILENAETTSTAVLDEESAQPEVTKAMHSLLQFTEYYNDKTKQEEGTIARVELQKENGECEVKHIQEIVVEDGFILGRPVKWKSCQEIVNKKNAIASRQRKHEDSDESNLASHANNNTYIDKANTKIASSSWEDKCSGDTNYNKPTVRDRSVDVNEFISVIAVHNNYVAIGNGLGQIAVMQKHAMTSAQLAAFTNLLRSSNKNNSNDYKTINKFNNNNNNMQETNNTLNGKHKHGSVKLHSSPTPLSRSIDARINARVRMHYEYLFSQRIYSPSLDPLYSEEISPRVNALAFLPHSHSTCTFLLTTNEVAPRLYKIIRTRPTAEPFRAVDKWNSGNPANLLMRSMEKSHPALSLPTEEEYPPEMLEDELTHNVTMKCVCSYAKVYESYIHTICPLPHDHQFITADKSTIKLWCVDYPDNAMDTFSLEEFEEEQMSKSAFVISDVIRTVHIFPQQPFLLFVVMASGAIRVLDTRESLRWNSQLAQTFMSSRRHNNYDRNRLDECTNLLSDCALSPCGRFIAGRSLLSVYLWDVRMALQSNKPWEHGCKQRRVSWTNTSSQSGHICNSASYSNNSSLNIVEEWEICPRLHKYMDVLYELNMHYEHFTIQFATTREVVTGGFGNELYMMSVVNTGNDTKGEKCKVSVKSTMNANSIKSSDNSNRKSEFGKNVLSEVQHKNEESSEVRVFQLPIWKNDASLPHLPLHTSYQGRSNNCSMNGGNNYYSNSQRESSVEISGRENQNEFDSSLSSDYTPDVDLSTRVSLLSRSTTSLTGLCEMMCVCNDVVYQLHYHSAS